MEREDEAAFRALTDPHRRALELHLLRMVGSAQDAEDLLQETLLAAWRDRDALRAPEAARAWLHGIATHRALDALRARRRRPLPALPGAPAPTRRAEPLHVAPAPDALLDAVADAAPGPAARLEAKEAVGLAFAVALARLPARQRAALVLRDVLGFRAAEVAELLGTSVGAANGLLQRARAAVADADAVPPPSSPGERALLDRFAAAVQDGDVDGMVALLTDDARLTMPPLPLEYVGRDAIAAFLADRTTARGTAFTLRPARANGQPAFRCHLGAEPWGMLLLTPRGDRIAALTFFAGAALVERFGAAA
jgi:RNA polymerase sigma-70 factor (TIGR02960 family)